MLLVWLLPMREFRRPMLSRGGAANPVETFSSDGPRRIFFTAAGVLRSRRVIFREVVGRYYKNPTSPPPIT